MNARAETLVARERARIADVVVLAKPGVTAMVLVTTAVGYIVAGGSWSALLVHLLGGTALLAGGAAALNMWIERAADGRMHRTEHRPLPAGRLGPGTALAFGASMSLGGVGWLAFLVGPLTAALGAASALIYVFAYTPLKKISTLNTLVGAVTGALPPVMGWTAVRAGLGVEAAILFAILFFWQLPHFLAIAWMYREDYERGGFRMLTVGDATGASTAAQVVLQTSALIFASAAPAVVGMAGPVYLAGAVTLGLGFLAFGALFAARRSRGRARALFFASITYLPLALGWLVLRTS